MVRAGLLEEVTFGLRPRGEGAGEVGVPGRAAGASPLGQERAWWVLEQPEGQCSWRKVSEGKWWDTRAGKSVPSQATVKSSEFTRRRKPR